MWKSQIWRNNLPKAQISDFVVGILVLTNSGELHRGEKILDKLLSEICLESPKSVKAQRNLSKSIKTFLNKK